jgi:transcriptional regulator with XRE-family HTH domain
MKQTDLQEIILICNNGCMADKKNPLGPTGEHVRANVARLRGRMQYKELSERLGAVGRPIPPLGLRRIEAGERRVDADDLMALAVVLGVPPNSLLLPHWDPAPEPAATAAGESNFRNLWLWADGEMPLSGKSDETAAESAQRSSLARPVFPDGPSGIEELRKRMSAAAMEFAVLTHEIEQALKPGADPSGDD